MCLIDLGFPLTPLLEPLFVYCSGQVEGVQLKYHFELKTLRDLVDLRLS